MDKSVENKINMMLPLLNEKQRRIYLASEAMAIGRGGITDVSRASGISRSVIHAGIVTIQHPPEKAGVLKNKPKYCEMWVSKTSQIRSVSSFLKHSLRGC